MCALRTGVGVGCRRVTEREPTHIQLCPLSVPSCEQERGEQERMVTACVAFALFSSRPVL